MERSAIREGGDLGVQRLMEKLPSFVDPSPSHTLRTRLALAGKYFEMGEHLLHEFCQKKYRVVVWWSPIGGEDNIWRGMFGVWSCRTLSRPKYLLTWMRKHPF